MVKNTGNRTGDEVVMVFVMPDKHLAPLSPETPILTSSDVPWIRKLTQYQRVHLKPGQSKTLQFQVSGSELHSVDPKTAEIVLVPGLYSIVLTNGVDESVACALYVQK